MMIQTAQPEEQSAPATASVTSPVLHAEAAAPGETLTATGGSVAQRSVMGQRIAHLRSFLPVAAQLALGIAMTVCAFLWFRTNVSWLRDLPFVNSVILFGTVYSLGRRSAKAMVRMAGQLAGAPALAGEKEFDFAQARATFDLVRWSAGMLLSVGVLLFAAALLFSLLFPTGGSNLTLSAWVVCLAGGILLLNLSLRGIKRSAAGLREWREQQNVGGGRKQYRRRFFR